MTKDVIDFAPVVEDHSVSELYADRAISVFSNRGNVRITFGTLRADPEGKGTTREVGRLVLPEASARELALQLYNLLGKGNDKPVQ